MKVTGKYYLFNRAIGYDSFSFMLLVLHVGVIYFESQLLGEGEKYTSFYINDTGVSTRTLGQGSSWCDYMNDCQQGQNILQACQNFWQANDFWKISSMPTWNLGLV